ncbi:hypothetical protein [Mycobacterium phage WXIN]|nr:hypothetical protein [Mycobacterium phage WXIN]
MQDWSRGEHIENTEHYSLLRHITGLASGTAVEFGTGSGQSARIMAEKLPVVTFGSIHGLPEDWRTDFPQGAFAYPLPEVDNATIIEGLFADTLPAYDFSALDIGLVHLDADLYSSTAIALDHVGPHLQPGCFLVFDEFWDYPGAEEHEQRALRERDWSWRAVGTSHEAFAIQLI